MKNSHQSHVKLGVFVLAGLLLFVLAIYSLGQMQNLFKSKITVYTTFKDVKGLQSGSGVHYMGIKVGTVLDVAILSDSSVRVEMGIDQDIAPFIQNDSRVEIDNEGLMGSKIIVIHAGSERAGPIEEREVLPSFTSISYEDILNELESTTTLTRQAAENLLEITEKISGGSGDLSRLINEDVLSRNIQSLGNELSELTDQAGEILREASQGENDLATLLNHNTLTSKLEGTLGNMDSTSMNLKLASERLLDASYQIRDGQGLIQKLLYDSLFTTEIDTAIHRVNEGVLTVEESAVAIKESWIINLFSGKSREKKKSQN